MTFVLCIAFAGTMNADDKAITVDKLPKAAREFLEINYPDVKVAYAVVDVDFLQNEYEVMLSNAVKVEFYSDGSLKNISCRAGIDEKFVPEAIRKYVNENFPGTTYLEYEADRKKHEIKLSNRLEISFDKAFNVIEIDD